MADLYRFMGEHPVVTVILALIVALTIGELCFRLPNRIMRHWNIRRHGYPPAHCDADGDFKPKETKDEEET